MPIKPAHRLNRLPHQLFARLVSQVEEARQRGHDVINLGQGNPDQPTPDHIVEALRRAAGDPQYQRYISFRGLTGLKEAVAEWYLRHHQVHLDPTREIAILIGSKIGLEEISLALLNPGDKVLAPDPGYPDYLSGIALAGAELVPWPLRAETNFLPPLDGYLENAKLAFLNYPNNPTGYLAPASFYDAVIERAHKTQTVLAHDLAYGDIAFDGRTSISLLSRSGGIEAGIEFTTLSKSYNMAGWRLGFACGNREVIEYLELLQDHLHCSQWGAVQEAGRAALLGPQDTVRMMRETYATRRDHFIDAAKAMGWMIPPSQGSIFLWCPLPRIKSSYAWAETFLKESGVMVAPGSGFGPLGEGYVRIALTDSIERLEDAATRMARQLSRHTRE